ncbi:MAG: VCBS repeat-containing protein, partial [Acidobacteria bacterium]|nr:VCBS repeat-containing protein [Acidobacteriota bacterium]
MTRRLAAVFPATLLLVALPSLLWSAEPPVVGGQAAPAGGTTFFRHATFADFAQGSLSSAGTGLYLARKGDRGEIRFVNRFDYNDDGFPEVVAVNDHNHYDTTPAILYRWTKDGALLSLRPPVADDRPGYEVLEHYVRARQQATLLPVLGGLSTAVGDFNGDGFADIALSGFVHGWNAEPYPLVLYTGGRKGFDPGKPILWPAGFYTGIAAADLDGDGCADLIATRRDGEYTTRANVLLPRAERLAAASAGARTALVFFGSRKLTKPPRTRELEALYALDAAAADLDGDSHPDVVLYEAGRDAGVRIHLAGPDRGFSGQGALIEVGNNAPWGFAQRKLHLADLNGDGVRDIVVPTKDELVILWNDGKGGFAADRKASVAIPGVYATAAGDFNGDGKRDLAVAVYQAGTGQPDGSWVLMNNGKGILEWETVLAPTQRAYGAAAADINGDGRDDVVFARYVDPVTGSYDANSVVYWGGSHAIQPGNSAPLATLGATDVTTIPSAARPGKRDILFVNRHSGLHGAGAGPTSGGMPSYIYWGNPTRSYSEVNMLKLPPLANELCLTATDLAAEDRTDVVAFELGSRQLSIFRPSSGGCEKLKSFTLPAAGVMVQAADTDRDGVLDLVVSAGGKLYLIRQPLTEGAKLEEIKLPAPITRGFALGDVDKDGLVDVLYGAANALVVLPGKAGGGFDEARSYSSPEMKKYILYLHLADFDGDGALDLLAFVFGDLDERGTTYNERAGSLLFWSRDGKLDFAHPTPVPTLGGAHGGAVADVNRDGRPDIVSANYHGGDTRLLDAQVLWNDGSRQFTQAHSATLPAFSAAAAQSLDYDRDGFMDLLVFNHSEPTEVFPGLPRGGRHSVGARLYWGGKDGFAKDRFTWIATYGPHSKQLPDPGSLADR